VPLYCQLSYFLARLLLEFLIKDQYQYQYISLIILSFVHNRQLYYSLNSLNIALLLSASAISVHFIYIMSVIECFIDLVYVVDSSGSINFEDARNWDITKEFLVDVSRKFAIGPNDVQVAFVLFSTNATVEWNLTRYRDQGSLVSAILNVAYLGGKTNLNDALYLTRTGVFAPGRGTRSGAVKAAIILTDGVDNVPTNGTKLTLQNATKCKNDGVHLVAIGVSERVNEQRLRQIVSPPADINYYGVDDFHSLADIVNQLTLVDCATTPGRATATPTSAESKRCYFTSETLTITLTDYMYQGRRSHRIIGGT